MYSNYFSFISDKRFYSSLTLGNIINCSQKKLCYFFYRILHFSGWKTQKSGDLEITNSNFMKSLNWKQIKNYNELIQKTWQKQNWDWDWISLLVSFALKWYWCFTMCHLTSFISLSNLYLKDQLIRLIKRKKEQAGPPAEQYIGNCLCLKDDWRGPILTKWTPDVFPSCNLTDLNLYKRIKIMSRYLINKLINISLKTSITNIFSWN